MQADITTIAMHRPGTASFPAVSEFASTQRWGAYLGPILEYETEHLNKGYNTVQLRPLGVSCSQSQEFVDGVTGMHDELEPTWELCRGFRVRRRDLAAGRPSGACGVGHPKMLGLGPGVLCRPSALLSLVDFSSGCAWSYGTATRGSLKRSGRTGQGIVNAIRARQN
jgi:hypothetical protein